MANGDTITFIFSCAYIPAVYTEIVAAQPKKKGFDCILFELWQLKGQRSQNTLHFGITKCRMSKTPIILNNFAM